MTLALFVVGALAAGAGTRAAAAVFIAAAGLGAASGTPPALVAWTAAMAAGLILVPGQPRRLALPLLGTAAVVAAGSTRNAAAVFGLWFLGTVAAFVTKGEGTASDRWCAALLLADVPVLAAVAWTAFRAGFEGWPAQLDDVAVALLLVGVVVRAPLISGPDDEPAAGLLSVRTQAALLPLVAIGALAPDSGLLAVWAIVAAAGFLAGGFAIRSATRDAIQEIALLAVVVSAAGAGNGPAGWEWGVLAAGALMHNLRLRLGSQPTGLLAGLLLRGGGLGLPLLPAVFVALEGAVRWSGWVGAAVLLGVAGGLAARASHPTTPPVDAPTDPAAASRPSSIVGVALAAAAVVAGLWAPVLTVPGGAAGDAIGWPPVWAAAAAAVVGGAGYALAPTIPMAGAERRSRLLRVSIPELRAPVAAAHTRVLAGGMAALGACALGMWAIGVVRGFL